MKTICINCPLGCMLEITGQGDEIVVRGNSCKRGEIYGKEEITAPKRVVTSLVKGKKYLYSVKTDRGVPKDKIFEVLEAIKVIQTGETEYEIGEVMVHNILGTTAELVVTGKSILI